MEVFGIGPLELLFIFIILILVLGPKDIEKTARNAGKLLNKVYKSPNYQVVRRASEELRNLPARLAREAQLDELKELADLSDVKQELQETANSIGRLNQPFDAWTKELKAGETAAPAAVNPPSNGTPPAARAAAAPPAAAPSAATPPATPPAATPATTPAAAPATEAPSLASTPAAPTNGDTHE